MSSSKSSSVLKPGEQFIPSEIRDILSGSLTEKGLGQWWRARNRSLDGLRPAERWTRDRTAVIAAAHAFDEGFYV